jgi:uncharacterized membrane protein (UPF0136 family)
MIADDIGLRAALLASALLLAASVVVAMVSPRPLPATDTH